MDRQLRSLRRWAMLAVLIVSGTLLSPGVAQAAEKAKAEAAALPSPLTPEAVRELVARLPDAEVRKLLIQQLDRGAVPNDAKKTHTDVMASVEQHSSRWRQRLATLAEGVRGLPAALAAVWAAIAEQSGPLRLTALAGMLAAMLVAGAVLEAIWRRVSRGARARFAAASDDGFLAGIVRLFMRMLVELAPPLVFGVGALAVYFAFWHGGPLTRIVLLGAVGTIVLARLVATLADFLLTPGRPQQRLLPVDDGPGRALVVGLTAIVLIIGVNYTISQELQATSAPEPVLQAFTVLISMLVLLIALELVRRLRVPIAERIRAAAGDGPIARWAADLWPVAAVLYLLSVFAGRVTEAMEGVRGRGEGILSLAILVAIPVVDYGLVRALERATTPAEGETLTGYRRIAHSYQPVLRRLIHIGVLVVGFELLAVVWGLDLFAMAERSLGGRIASSLIGILIVVLLAYVAWDAARTAIDRRLAEEAHDEHGPTSRLRTLLPLLRVTIAVTILVMAVMSVLAAMGVDILPLLAGASVVGVAIGFGSQTLVRDVVSGAFFLMDDAFRLGEYIEVGDARGRIEKITLRSLFLRHHRGALNILPYGEIKRLRNTSRDWMVMVLEFKLAFDTDLKKVKKLIKGIAEEIATDPVLGEHLLSPVKSQGVLSTDDSSITVRVKYTAKPGDGPFMIRRAAYEKILKAFMDNDVHFAGKRVEVYVPQDSAPGTRAIAGAAALQAIDAKPAA